MSIRVVKPNANKEVHQQSCSQHNIMNSHNKQASKLPCLCSTEVHLRRIPPIVSSNLCYFVAYAENNSLRCWNDRIAVLWMEVFWIEKFNTQSC